MSNVCGGANWTCELTVHACCHTPRCDTSLWRLQRIAIWNVISEHGSVFLSYDMIHGAGPCSLCRRAICAHASRNFCLYRKPCNPETNSRSSRHDRHLEAPKGAEMSITSDGRKNSEFEKPRAVLSAVERCTRGSGSLVSQNGSWLANNRSSK